MGHDHQSLEVNLVPELRTPARSLSLRFFAVDQNIGREKSAAKRREPSATVRSAFADMV
jgi:hypothetical protein